MKFTITRDSFQRGLAAVTASVPARTTLPVLSNVLLEADEGLKISATDLDIAVSIQISADVEEKGTITVAARRLQDLVKELPDQLVQVTAQGDGIELVCGKSSFQFAGLPAEEFPSFPAVDFGECWQVKGGLLQTLIGKTRFAVSTEESRPILNGVLWELRDDHMGMIATNGHRLARMRAPLSVAVEKKADLIVPPKALDQVGRLFRSDAVIEVARSENYLGFRHEGTQVFTRLIEGPYPPYEQVIPKDNDKLAQVNRESFTKAVRRMAVVASESTRRIHLGFGPGGIRLSVTTPDLGQGREEMDVVSYEGDPLEVGFNANYLLEILRFFSTEEIKISLKESDRAVLVEPVGAEGEEADYLCLVMPLRIND